jgi:signal transduction histidine kinase/CheY-like chemotaxis protein
MLAVPLSDRGRMIGTVVVCSRLAQRFGADEQRFLESLSNLLATCLQRAQSEDALKHAQRLESVGQLTGGIAHDFNNLLTVIQGNLQVLEELPLLADDAYGRQLVAAATRASRRGAELTGKLLAFSRRQVLQPSSLNVSQLLHSLADMLRRTLDQRIRIEVDVAEACPPVLADPGQLESALLNIAINARDAMLEGGTLRFEAQPCAALPAEVRNNLDDPSALEDGFVAIAISDTGSGMPEAVKQRAFEPFFTTKEAGRGTGLGLSTVYGFVRQSKGALSLVSAPDAGTMLTMYLPRPWETTAAGSETAEPEQALADGLKVLLVEDDAEVRDVVRTFLESLRCQVTLANSGEQALLALGPDADFDLLLSDIALGSGMRGTQLAKLAQARLPGMAVLLMSGYSAELLDADRDAPLSWELLRKPYTRSELAAVMARLMAARGGPS